MTIAEACIPLTDERGRIVGHVRIVSHTADSVFALTPAEALARNEEAVQIVEGRTYDAELLNTPDGWMFEHTEVVQTNRINPRIARIEPGLWVGLLPITVVAADSTSAARAMVEVRTAKLAYATEYRYMLDDLVERTLQTVTEIRSPVMTRLRPNPHLSADSLHHQYAFVRGMLDRRSFWDALDRILASPHEQWRTEVVQQRVQRSSRPTRQSMHALARGRNRTPLPSTHALAEQFAHAGIARPSVPSVLPLQRGSASTDTPANQFIVFALQQFVHVIASIEQRAAARSDVASRRLHREAQALRKRLSTVLANAAFQDVSHPRTLTLSSPVLQRKTGYRDVLRAWLSVHLAANLTWDGGPDVYLTGRRDVAQLYEYWLFFQLLDVVTRTFVVDAPPAATLIEQTHDGFELRLKSGRALSFTGKTRGDGAALRVRFSYNRTFGGVLSGASYPRPGSWTRSMRPDYTLSLWPEHLSEEEAEQRERIAHVHFDAKYRVDGLLDLFGSGETDLEEEKQAERANIRAKRSDLLKMHAYRDAIRRTEGAYVLYPGVNEKHMWYGFHEILPGLGAFAVRPTAERAGPQAIEDFVAELANHLQESQSRRSQLRDATYRIFAKDPAIDE